MSQGEIELEYERDEQPPTGKALLLGLQHVAVMLVPATAVAYIVAGEVGTGAPTTAYLVQMVLLFSGLATLVQAYAVGPIGSRLPIVMGTSFTFLGASIAIGLEYGLGAVFGAVLVTGVVVEGLIGWQFKRVKKFFPPLVTGLVVIIIGLYLVPAAMNYVAGGEGSAHYGALYNLGLGGLVLAVAVGLNLFTDGVSRLLSTLVAIVVGYVGAVALEYLVLPASAPDLVSFDAVASAAWVQLPMPVIASGTFSLQFEPVAIVTFAFLFLVSAMETVGDMSGVTAAEGRNPTDEEFRGGILTDGIMSSLGAFFGAFPMTSFSQNVGIVNFTGVMSRYVVGIAGVMLAILGLSPKVGALVATIPSAVFGGAVLLMAGMVAASGARLVFVGAELDRRNMVVIAVSLGLGIGVVTQPAAFEQLPAAANTFFTQPVIMTALSALVLNTLAPGEQSPFDIGSVDEPVADAEGASVDDD